MAPRAQNDAARGIGKNASTTLLLVLFDREIVLVLVLILGLGLCTRTSSPRPFLAWRAQNDPIGLLDLAVGEALLRLELVLELVLEPTSSGGGCLPTVRLLLGLLGDGGGGVRAVSGRCGCSLPSLLGTAARNEG